MPASVPHRVVLLRHSQTETCASDEQGSTQVQLTSGEIYFTKRKPVLLTALRTFPSSYSYDFHWYPIVLWGNGAPWYEANLWLHEKLVEAGCDAVKIGSIVDDLVAYAKFLEDEDLGPICWADFSAVFPPQRPTYRFRTYLSDLVECKKLEYSVANRRLKTIIRFYRWLVSEAGFTPEYPLWRESVVQICVQTGSGNTLSIPTTRTDLKITGQPKPDPTDETVFDGGKLRPMNSDEQEWVQEALCDYDNYEIQLMHWLALYTGARIQTVLTLRRKNFWKGLGTNSPFGIATVNYCPQLPTGYVTIPTGPGTGVDTKFSKKHLLFVPVWLYERIHTFIHGERVTKRRARAIGGDIPEQYIFLTKHNIPWYASNQIPSVQTDSSNNRRSGIRGGALRTLIAQEIEPRIAKKTGFDFKYRYHDLRATFGVNEIHRLLGELKDPTNLSGPRWSLSEVLNWVAGRLNHSSISVTEGYIRVRENTKLTRAIQDKWEARISERAHENNYQGVDSLNG